MCKPPIGMFYVLCENSGTTIFMMMQRVGIYAAINSNDGLRPKIISFRSIFQISTRTISVQITKYTHSHSVIQYYKLKIWFLTFDAFTFQ